MILVTATQYQKTFESGHSRPCLVEAETAEGEQLQVVMKFRDSVIGSAAGLAREMLASRLASALGLQTPMPCQIEIIPEFVASLEDQEAMGRFSANLGLNYGSIFVTGGWSAISYGKDLPHSLAEPATSVIGFDALIGNDDRHSDKTNYLIRGNEVIVIDHERAFPSFHPGWPRPWEDGGLRFLRNHAFFKGLKSQMPDFTPLQGALNSITAHDLTRWVAEIPIQWKGNGIAEELETYLMTLRENSSRILETAKNLLR